MTEQEERKIMGRDGTGKQEYERKKENKQNEKKVKKWDEKRK